MEASLLDWITYLLDFILWLFSRIAAVIHGASNVWQFVFILLLALVVLVPFWGIYLIRTRFGGRRRSPCLGLPSGEPVSELADEFERRAAALGLCDEPSAVDAELVLRQREGLAVRGKARDLLEDFVLCVGDDWIQGRFFDCVGGGAEDEVQKLPLRKDANLYLINLVGGAGAGKTCHLRWFKERFEPYAGRIELCTLERFLKAISEDDRFFRELLQRPVPVYLLLDEGGSLSEDLGRVFCDFAGAISARNQPFAVLLATRAPVRFALPAALIVQSFELWLQPQENELLFKRYALAIAGYGEGTPERGELINAVGKVWKRLDPPLRSSPRWLESLAGELVRTVASGGSLDGFPVTVPALVERAAERERGRWLDFGLTGEGASVAEALVGLAGLGVIAGEPGEARAFLKCVASRASGLNPNLGPGELEKVVRLLFGKDGAVKLWPPLVPHFLRAALRRYGDAFLTCALLQALAGDLGEVPRVRAERFLATAERVQRRFETFLSELREQDPAAREEEHHLRRLFESAWQEALNAVRDRLDCEAATGEARVLCDLAELGKGRDQKTFTRLAEAVEQLARSGQVRLARWGLQKLLGLGQELSKQERNTKVWLAAILSNLGVRLSELGRRKEALRAMGEAVRYYRELVARNPDVFLPYLAVSLHNLGNALYEFGLREEALRAEREAVKYYRELIKKHRETYLPPLAISLNNLGIVLSELGRQEEALRAAEEAVELFSELVKKNRDVYLPDLARSLNNLGNVLSALGRWEEALKAAAETVQHYRVLAAKNPEALLPNLAGSLNNLGARLSELGQREEALKAAEEATQIYRELAARAPEAFLPYLAMSLNNLGNRLSELGQREEALKATEEAVEYYRELAARNPGAFLPGLAGSLSNLGIVLSALGRRGEALKAGEEAVQIRRRLITKNPKAYLPDLAMGLHNLGTRLSALGRWEEALKAAEEAVQHYRALAAKNPEAFLPYLAGSLNNLGNVLSKLGRREEALKATEEAVWLDRELAARSPGAFLPGLAMSLNNLGLRLSELGRREEALRATEEAFLSLLPFYLRYREAHGELMQKIINRLRAFGAAGLSVSHEVCEKLAGLQVEVPGCAPAVPG